MLLYQGDSDSLFLAISCWLLVVGLWSLVIGLWSLVISDIPLFFHFSFIKTRVFSLNLPALSAASLWQAGRRSECEGGNLNLNLNLPVRTFNCRRRVWRKP